MKTILSLICLLSFATVLNAQRAGTLDSSFGVDGKVTTNVNGTYYGIGSVVESVLLEKNGQIVVAGNSKAGLNTDVLLSKYLPNGKIDENFGINGYVHYGRKSIEYSDDYLYQAKLQSDGKIVTIIQTNGKPLLIRFNAKGDVDSSFGINGVVGLSYDAKAIDMDSDDAIIVGGDHKEHTELMLTLQKFSKDGQPDLDFGNNNYTSLNIGKDQSGFTDVLRIKISNDGKIVLGTTLLPKKTQQIVVARFRANGDVDSTFSDSGYLVIDTLRINLSFSALNFQGNKLVIGGNTFNDFNVENNFIIIRLAANGTIDRSFGKKGFVVTDFSFDTLSPKDDMLYALCVQNDGKIVAAGASISHRRSNGVFALSRYEINGGIDTSFGFFGRVKTNFADTYDAEIGDASIQTDGKIIAAGYDDTLGSSERGGILALARYSNDEQTLNNIEDSKTSNGAILNNISLAPNPVNSILTINGLSASTKYTVRITNVNGSTVVNKQISNFSSYQINVQSLSAGVYYINIISNNNQTTTLKFIKQ